MGNRPRMVSEDNIKFMRQRGARYLVGTPKSMLKKFERELLGKGWEEVHPGVEVKICPRPEGGETFVLCRSEGRKDKETAILNRFIVRLEAGLGKLKELADKGKLRDRQKAERRIGRLLERNSRSCLSVHRDRYGDNGRQGQSPGSRYQEKRGSLPVGASKRRQLYPAHKLTEADPKTIWKRYIQLRKWKMRSEQKSMISECGLSTIESKIEPRPISWFAFWRWRCGERFSSG